MWFKPNETLCVYNKKDKSVSVSIERTPQLVRQLLGVMIDAQNSISVAQSFVQVFTTLFGVPIENREVKTVEVKKFFVRVVNDQLSEGESALTTEQRQKWSDDWFGGKSPVFSTVDYDLQESGYRFQRHRASLKEGDVTHKVTVLEIDIEYKAYTQSELVEPGDVPDSLEFVLRLAYGTVIRHVDLTGESMHVGLPMHQYGRAFTEFLKVHKKHQRQYLEVMGNLAGVRWSYDPTVNASGEYIYFLIRKEYK